MSSLAINLFGTFAIQRDGQDVDTFATTKARGLLAYLAVEGTRPLDRTHLAGFLWPDVLDESARANLRYTLSNVRKAIGDHTADPPYLRSTRRTIQLNPDALDAGTVVVDVHQFQTLYQQAVNDRVAAKAAIALYHASFLNNPLVTDSPEFDTWAQLQREMLHRQMAELLHRAVVQLLETGAFAEAVPYAKRGVDHEPWREEAHVHLMNALWRSGQVNAAMRQYEICRRLLREELDVTPSPETVALYATIRDDRHAFGAVEVVDASTVPKKTVYPKEVEPKTENEREQPYDDTVNDDANHSDMGSADTDCGGRLHNLPETVKLFIGRTEELAEIDAHFAQPHCRLLTVIAPGGMGKTQLALEFARRQIDVFPDGVWFVPLAGIADVEQIPSTIVDALGLMMTSEQTPSTRLEQHLRQRTLLLILDNFEHLLTGAILIPDLLRIAPNLSILVTSRVRLNLQAERVFVLGGLALSTHDEQAEGQAESDSVALFVESAQRADISFTLTADARSAVVEICRLIDGMPLGIELAAVWTRLLPCHEIFANLQRSTDLLAVSMPDVPARHRSMSALIEESWQNLSTETQQVFACASVFRGGCDWPALQEVTNASMLHVAELIDRGFLRRMSDGSYQIHELMRQYGAERLAESSPAETSPAEVSQSESAVTARHAHHYLHFLQRTTADLMSMEQAEAVRSIAVRIENIRAAWRWALDARLYKLLDSALESLFNYYRNRGLAYEGAELFEQTAERLAIDTVGDADAPVALLVNVRNHLSVFLELLGRTDECCEMLTQNLVLAREYKLVHGTAWALVNLGAVIAWNEVDRATKMFEESQRLFEELEDAEGIIAALGNLWYFVLVRQLDLQPALATAKEALMWSHDLNAPLLIAENLKRVGGTYTRLRQFEQAEAYEREALELAQQLQYKSLEAELFNSLSLIARNQGEYERSRPLIEESLKIHQQIGMESSAALTAQENLGRLVSRMGDWEMALRQLQETAAKSQSVNNEFMRGRCHEGLAWVWYQLGDYQQARQELQSAIAVNDVWILKDMQTIILETFIMILMAEDVHETAALLFAYKVHHHPPARDSLVDSDGIEVTLRTTLGDDRYQQIAEDAPQRDLDELLAMAL